jgi:hypothetical protein
VERNALSVEGPLIGGPRFAASDREALASFSDAAKSGEVRGLFEIALHLTGFYPSRGMAWDVRMRADVQRGPSHEPDMPSGRLPSSIRVFNQGDPHGH